MANSSKEDGAAPFQLIVSKCHEEQADTLHLSSQQLTDNLLSSVLLHCGLQPSPSKVVSLLQQPHHHSTTTAARTHQLARVVHHEQQDNRNSNNNTTKQQQHLLPPNVAHTGSQQQPHPTTSIRALHTHQLAAVGIVFQSIVLRSTIHLNLAKSANPLTGWQPT